MEWPAWASAAVPTNDGRNPGSGKMETFSEVGVSLSPDGFGKLE
jgi:hypothetical protein